MPAQTRNKKSPVQPVKSHIPSRPTPTLPLRAVPKGLVPAGLSIEEKAARYDQMLSTRKQKQLIKRRISELYHEMDNLEAEEAKVLDHDIVSGFSLVESLAEPCPGCGFEVCNCERNG